MANTNNPILANRGNINQILKDLVHYYHAETTAVVHHLYEKGYSYEDVAKIFGVTKQAVFLRFPKEARS